MVRVKILVLLGCSVVCVGILYGLYAMSPLSKEVFRASFTRDLMDDTVVEEAVIDLIFNSFYFAGQGSGRIYLGNYSAPFYLLHVDTTLSDTTHVNLSIGLDSAEEVRRFRLAVREPYFFLFHGTMPKVLRGRVDAWRAEDLMGDSAGFHVEALPLSGNSYVTRAYSASQQGYELGLETRGKSHEFSFDLLRKQLDGIFCLDGQLLYNEYSQSLIYMHYYRNELVVCDTSLQLKYRGHTIDTFTHARIKVAHIASSGSNMLSAPPMQINGSGATDGPYLFIRSMLLAANEDALQFMRNAVVDVYGVAVHGPQSTVHSTEAFGDYVGSFYIPHYEGEAPREFRVVGDQLFVLSGHHLVKYRLSLTSIQQTNRSRESQ